MTDASVFRALVTRELEPGRFVSAIETRTIDELPPGDVTIAVRHSSLNYKDMLSATGNRGVTRSYPHVPGIDAAGTVVASSDPTLPVGTEAVVIGYDLGMGTSGGFGERIRVPAGWVLRRPETLSSRAAMQHGTAGLTAALCVYALLESGARPEHGDVVVTGASGGVGAIALAMLKKHHFRVVAVSRRSAAHELLRALGADEIVTPEAIATSGGKPMAKERWGAAVDTVGGELLFEVVKSLRYGAAVAACGMAGGSAFSANVFPFILRGARLLGVDSVNLPHERKQRALDSLAGIHRIDALDRIASEIELDDLPRAIEALRRGDVIGRHVVRVAAGPEA